VIGKPPQYLGRFDFSLREVMYYLYLPVRMGASGIRLPANVECCRNLIEACSKFAAQRGQEFEYIYLSARKGWATPDNPLNRPGWHCDGYGTDDLNFVWWTGPGTRFALQKFYCISEDHQRSLMQFGEQVDLNSVVTYAAKGLYAIDAEVVHATPIIEAPGCMRQYVKVSMSNHQYNLENNSHNYLFEYEWQLFSREAVRNDPAATQKDWVQP
jgi:hypothetical protein